MKRISLLFLIAALSILLGGCVTDAQRADISANSQAQYNAAAALQPSAQTKAIQDLAVANANAIGLPITPLTGTAAPAATVTAPKASP